MKMIFHLLFAFSSLLASSAAFVPVARTPSTVLFAGATIELVEEEVETSEWLAEKFAQVRPSDVLFPTKTCEDHDWFPHAVNSYKHALTGQNYFDNKMSLTKPAYDTAAITPVATPPAPALATFDVYHAQPSSGLKETPVLESFDVYHAQPCSGLKPAPVLDTRGAAEWFSQSLP